MGGICGIGDADDDAAAIDGVGRAAQAAGQNAEIRNGIGLGVERGGGDEAAEEEGGGEFHDVSSGGGVFI